MVIHILKWFIFISVLFRKGKSYQSSSPSTKAVLSSPTGSSVTARGFGNYRPVGEARPGEKHVVVCWSRYQHGQRFIPDFRWMLFKTFKPLLNRWFTRLTTVCVSGHQGRVFMRTLRSMTSLTQRPSLTSTTSLTTRILSSHWLKSCTLDTTVQTMFIISSECCIRRACCSACTLRTSMDSKNVRDLIYHKSYICSVVY